MVKTPHDARNHGSRWTIAEMDYVEKHYRTGSTAEIAAHLGRTVQAVKGMARKLLSTENPIQQWREDEKNILTLHYNSPTPLQTIFAQLPGRSPTAVMAMARKMGLSRPANDWTKEEISCLRQYYPSEGQGVLRRLPCKSDEAIRDKARELDIASPGHTQSRMWEEKEWQTLSENLHLRPVELLHLFPERNLSSIKNALIRLKRSSRQGKLPAAPHGSKKMTTAWSDAEKAVLIRWYGSDKTMDEILAMLPGRPRSSVFSQARKLGLSRPLSDWSETELQLLRDYYPAEGSAVAKRLPGRERNTVSQKAFQMGLRMTDSTPRQPWSAEDVQRLEASLHLPLPALQQMFPERSVASLKKAIYLIKTREKA